MGGGRPTRYDGDFYTCRYLNTWPKPMQRPRPKSYIVGSGSAETVNLAVEAGCGYSIVFTPIKNQLRASTTSAGSLSRAAGPCGRTT